MWKITVLVLGLVLGRMGFASSADSVSAAMEVISRFAGNPSQNNFLKYDITDPSLGNNGCAIVVTIRTQNNTDSAGVIEILPKMK